MAANASPEAWQRSFGECLDPHDAGQHRRAVDLVVVQERLNLRIESGLDREAVKSSARDRADHRSGAALPSDAASAIQPAGRVPFFSRTPSAGR